MEVCHQTNGSYYCQCREGYELNDDNTTCSGMISNSIFCNSIYPRIVQVVCTRLPVYTDSGDESR